MSYFFLSWIYVVECFGENWAKPLQARIFNSGEISGISLLSTLNHFRPNFWSAGDPGMLPGFFWETKGLMCLDPLMVKFTTAFWCWTSAKRVPNARRGSRHLGVSVWKSIAQPHRAPTTMCARTQHVQIWISAPFSQLSWHSQAHWKHCRGEATHTAFPNQIFSFHRKKRSLH